MEIELPRRLLAAAGICLAVAALLLVGIAASPRNAEGRPLLLSPERRAILRYRRLVGNWAGRLEEVAARCDRLTPVQSGEDREGSGELPTPPVPASIPGDLYGKAHQAQEALEVATTLQVEVERARVPATMVGLHGLVTAAVEAHVEWAGAVLSYVGAPGPVQVERLTELRRVALEALGLLREALDATG